MVLRCSALILCATLAHGQGMPVSLSASPNPAPPGGQVMGTVTNTGSNPIFYTFGQTVLHLLHTSGELIAPRYQSTGDVVAFLQPGASASFSVVLPSSGPGSSGSFLLYTSLGDGAVTRVDVGAPSSPFPAVHAFSPRVENGFASHQVWNPGVPLAWRFANASATTVTLGVGAEIRLLSPAGALPLTTPTSLSGLSLAPGQVQSVPVATGLLAPGPATLEIAWNDPVVGPRVRRAGIRETSSIELHLPGGRDVPFGGTLPVRFAGGGFPSAITAPPQYAFVVGATPGNISLPGAGPLPLGEDLLVIESLTSGLFGYLGNNVTTGAQVYPCFCGGVFWISIQDTVVAHPTVAVVSGLTLLAGAVFFDPASATWGATRVEEIRFL